MGEAFSENGKGLPSIFFIVGFLIYVIDASLRILSYKAASLAQASGLIISPHYPTILYRVEALWSRAVIFASNPFRIYPVLLVLLVLLNGFIFLRYSRHSTYTARPPSFIDFYKGYPSRSTHI